MIDTWAAYGEAGNGRLIKWEVQPGDADHGQPCLLAAIVRVTWRWSRHDGRPEYVTSDDVHVELRGPSMAPLVYSLEWLAEGPLAVLWEDYALWRSGGPSGVLCSTDGADEEGWLRAASWADGVKGRAEIAIARDHGYSAAVVMPPSCASGVAAPLAIVAEQANGMLMRGDLPRRPCDCIDRLRP